MAALDTVAVPNNNRSLTDLLRSSLLSIREALFRHASFLEFLPAPERIDRKRVVQGEGGMEGGIPGRLAGDGSGQEKGGGEELDPEVNEAFFFLSIVLRCACTKVQAGWELGRSGGFQW